MESCRRGTADELPTKTKIFLFILREGSPNESFPCSRGSQEIFPRRRARTFEIRPFFAVKKGILRFSNIAGAEGRTRPALSLAFKAIARSRSREVETSHPKAILGTLRLRVYRVSQKYSDDEYISGLCEHDEAILGSSEGESARKTMFLSLSLPTC